MRIPEPVQLTTGPRQHWMGYYDKHQIDPSGRYAVACEVETFFHSPSVDDVLRVGVIDLEDGNRWQEIGTSTSWGWQQSCMLQWVPGDRPLVFWNDHDETGNGFVGRLHDRETGETRTLPKPLYTLSPCGTYGLGLDFARLQFYRPGYGYPTRDPIDHSTKIPAEGGIYRMDLATGESEVIVSYAEVAKLDRPQGSVAHYHHWLNHILINPSGDRFIFLNRSRPRASETEMRAYVDEHGGEWAQGRSAWLTRAITASTGGGDLYALNDSGLFSHFIWKGGDVVTAWTKSEASPKAGFFELTDRTKEAVQVGAGVMTRDGHNTYVPGTDHDWILNDAGFPREEGGRVVGPYLYHVPTDRKIILGEFPHAPEFKGEFRCDLHPRCDRAGRRVFFDSAHVGDQRQVYSIDISGIVG